MQEPVIGGEFETISRSETSFDSKTAQCGSFLPQATGILEWFR